MRSSHLLLVALIFSTHLAASGAPDPPAANTLAKLPVREVTAFKDGHAFVLHEGSLPTDASGNVVMDYLPKGFAVVS